MYRLAADGAFPDAFEGLAELAADVDEEIYWLERIQKNGFCDFFHRGSEFQVEAVQLHNLAPRGGEVVGELCSTVSAGVDFRERAEDGV